MIDFQAEIFPKILRRLAKKSVHYTKSNRKPNRVKIDGTHVYVMTEKSKPDYEEIPYWMFEKTWEVLVAQIIVTQRELSQVHNVKRSTFMLIAFDLIDEVVYDFNRNALRLGS